METTYKIIISQDGKVIETLTNQTSDGPAFGKLLRLQGQSTDWALRHGGWKVEQINEQTGVSEFWKPYDRIKR